MPGSKGAHNGQRYLGKVRGWMVRSICPRARAPHVRENTHPLWGAQPGELVATWRLGKEHHGQGEHGCGQECCRQQLCTTLCEHKSCAEAEDQHQGC